MTLEFTYNPADEIVTNTRSNDAYAYTGIGTGAVTEATNGLNQLVSRAGTTLDPATGTTSPAEPVIGYDRRGNMVSDGTRNFVYTAENILSQRPGVFSMVIDSLGRIRGTRETQTFVETPYDYHNWELLAEHTHGSGPVARRYVHGPGVDEVLVHYEGSGTTDRRWLHAEERGSIIAQSNDAGTVTAIVRYDEFGQPHPNNVGRFQYTGQLWMPLLGLHYYKNRMYDPKFGRFVQTDPIGYGDGMNMYA